VNTCAAKAWTAAAVWRLGPPLKRRNQPPPDFPPGQHLIHRDLDGARDSAHAFRDRFGSYPTHDRYDDESEH
jgi:hypothetical protein